MKTLSDAATRALTARAIAEYLPRIIKIEHPDLATPLRFTDRTGGLTHNAEMYEFRRLRITIPKQSDNEVANAKITIDNVDRRIVFAVQSMVQSADVTCTLAVLLGSNHETIVDGPYPGTITAVSYRLRSAEAEVVIGPRLDYIASTISYTNLAFPGLYG